MIPKNEEVYAVIRFYNFDGSAKPLETATLTIESDDPGGDFVLNLEGQSS